ncbi:hypothetical protein [Chengkuizengella axinellae]|uniref:Uncharacterized protein n=1 Tax=Chengkuizengella axinellae TaxID=3064388 RepID=A0ABT9J026_9BACL|nr:hypothetical protein [Chengkuizengella sp. 2205SS18-9]MDP5274966.1 hypothetical protein [Chengkuizengella sp. 2205SS18-9]
MSASTPLIIGITGHRNLHEDAVEAVTAEIHLFFQEVLKVYDPQGVVLQTPLAEGADRLAAKVAESYGISIKIPLPFAIDIYINDFKTKQSKQSFYYFVERSDSVFIPNIHHYQIKNKLDGYKMVGSYIAQTSHILLALWDCNKQLEKPGGTAQILRFQFEGFEAPLMLSSSLENRKTYLIYTPRNDDFQINPIKGRYIDQKTYQSI